MSKFRRQLMMANVNPPVPPEPPTPVYCGYIVDGLTFIIDGIEKGTDNDAWTDLVGGIKFPYVTGVTADTDNVAFASGHSAMVADKGLSYNSLTDATIEVVWTYSHTNNQQSIIRPNVKGVCFFQYYRTEFGFAAVSSAAERFATLSNPVANRVEGKKLCVSYSPNLGYINGALGTNSTNRYILTGSLTLGINYVGKIHCIRIYNRVLTEEERLANYALDVERFNIT